MARLLENNIEGVCVIVISASKDKKIKFENELNASHHGRGNAAAIAMVMMTQRYTVDATLKAPRPHECPIQSGVMAPSNSNG